MFLDNFEIKLNISTDFPLPRYRKGSIYYKQGHSFVILKHSAFYGQPKF